MLEQQLRVALAAPQARAPGVHTNHFQNPIKFTDREFDLEGDMDLAYWWAWVLA